MNANLTKFYAAFTAFCASDRTVPDVKKHVPDMLAADFARTAEMWEYFAAADDTDPVFGDGMFRLFFAKSPKATVKLLTDVPAIRKIVYGLSPAVTEGDLLQIVADLLLSGKLADGEELIKCVLKNPNTAFGAYMKALVEKLFVEILKRSDNARIVMNRKLSALLLPYIAKIKTDERALLEQRIKEIN